MTPRQLFLDLWRRGDELAGLYDNLLRIGMPQHRAGELLRAEWVARLAALDLFIHELVATRLLLQFQGILAPANGFSKFRLSVETLRRVVEAKSEPERAAAFDLDVRVQLSSLTFQMPDKIADGIRFTSDIKLWEAVAAHQSPGACGTQLKDSQKDIRTTLSAMVERRNKIAHEGDLMPNVPRQPWPIAIEQLEVVRSFIQRLVESIEAVVAGADAAGLIDAEADAVPSGEPANDEQQSGPALAPAAASQFSDAEVLGEQPEG